MPITDDQQKIFFHIRDRKIKPLVSLLKTISPNFRNSGGVTPLMFAMDENDDKSVKALIDAKSEKANVNDFSIIDKPGIEKIKIITTPLLLAVFKNKLSWIKLLVSKGAVINGFLEAKSDNAIAGDTVLNTAVKMGHLEVAEELIKSGADVNALGVNNIRPFDFAVQTKSLAACQLLKKYGGDPTLCDHYTSPFLEAIENLKKNSSRDANDNDFKIIMLLADFSNIDHREKLSAYAYRYRDTRFAVFLPEVIIEDDGELILEAGDPDLLPVEQSVQPLIAAQADEAVQATNEFEEMISSIEKTNKTIEDKINEFLLKNVSLRSDTPIKIVPRKKSSVKIIELEDEITSFEQALGLGNYAKVWDFFNPQNIEHCGKFLSHLLQGDIRVTAVIAAQFFNKPELVVTMDMIMACEKKPEILKLAQRRFDEQQTKVLTKTSDKKVASKPKEVVVKQPVAKSAPRKKETEKPVVAIAIPSKPKLSKAIKKKISTMMSEIFANGIKFAVEEQRKSKKAEKKLRRATQQEVDSRQEEELVNTSLTQVLSQLGSAPVAASAPEPIVESLLQAAMSADLATVKRLLADSKRSEQNQQEMISAFIWAGSNRPQEVPTVYLMREALVQYGVLSYPADDKGNPLLHAAIIAQDWPMIELCISFGSQVLHFANQEDKTPLDLAVDLADYVMCEYLLNAGAVPSRNYSKELAEKSEQVTDLPTAINLKRLQILFANYELGVLCTRLESATQPHIIHSRFSM